MDELEGNEATGDADEAAEFDDYHNVEIVGLSRSR